MLDMLAIRDIGDWIEGAIVVVVLVGSALSGLGKMILAKMKERKQAESEAREGGRSPTLTERPVARPMRPPVARPMPPPRLASSRPTVTIRTESVSPRVDSPRPPVEVDVQVPESIRPLVEMLLGRNDEDEAPPPARPAPPPRTAQPRPRKPRPAPTVESTRPKLGNEARMGRIEKREEERAQRSDQRIGHVETHIGAVAAETDPSARPRLLDAFDRVSLRRAILLNEILGPPVSLRPTGL